MRNLSDPSLFKESNLINGQWIDAKSGRKLEIHNPFNQERLGSVPCSGREEANLAIQAAGDAFSHWKKTTAKERSIILKDWFRLVLSHMEDLARILTLEQGKSIQEARAEIKYAASYIEWFSEEAKRTYGDIIPSHRKDTRIFVTKEPIGVVATITPWNFPSAMLARKVSAAFASGCTVVSKPSEFTPYSALALAVLAERAGLPRGVWNLVTGDPEEIGEALLMSPTVRKLSFTGSTRVGMHLMERSATTLKKLSLELGGNAPFLVFHDADLENAVQGAIHAKFRNSGQTCVSVNRFLVSENIAEEFAHKLALQTSLLKLGNGLDESVQLGPLIHEKALQKVKSHIEDAKAKGARIILGGNKHSLGGNFLEPTVLYPVTKDMLVCSEETFGPVAAIQTFKTEEEAIQSANDTSSGLAAYVYTKDIARLFRVTEALEFGMIGANESAISSEQIPFGGVKFSGMGREGSKYGLDDYTVTKYICLGAIT